MGESDQSRNSEPAITLGAPPTQPETPGGQEGRGLRERARRVMPGGIGRSTFMVGSQPPYVMKGYGCYVRNEFGSELIDLNNNFASLIHGHAEPRVTTAATEALKNGASFGAPNVYELEHAERLIGRMPQADLVRYANSGTEAVMIALRLARAYTAKDKCLIIRNAYHGTSDPVLSAGGPASARGVPHATQEETVLLDLNDHEALSSSATELRGSIGAILIDLLPNRAGLLPVEDSYLEAVLEICEAERSLLICDEIVSFRLHPNGLSRQYGFTPDITVLGKLIGGGLPVGAITGKREVMMELDPGSPDSLEHGGTFSGNPVTMAAGAVTLDLLDAAQITRLNSLGDLMRERLTAPLESRGWDLRGRGSLLRPFPRTENPRESHVALWWAGQDHGLLLNPNGLIALSTAMDDALIEEASRRLIDAIASLSA